VTVPEWSSNKLKRHLPQTAPAAEALPCVADERLLMAIIIDLIRAHGRPQDFFQGVQTQRLVKG